MNRALKCFTFLSFSIALLACDSISQTSPPDAAVRAGIIGEWRLVEFVADIGSGTSGYQSAEGRIAETLQFRSNGLFVATTDRHPNQFRAYRVIDDERVEMVFKPDVGNKVSHTWYYRDVTDSTLTLSYGCFEACVGKYTRIR